MEEVRSSILLSSTIGPPARRAVPRSGASGGAVGPLDAGDVGPEPLEVVELALLLLEHVDDEVAVVHQHPLTIGQALDPAGLGTSRRRDLLLDLVADGLDLAVVRRAGDHEPPAERQQVADVEDHDIPT